MSQFQNGWPKLSVSGREMTVGTCSACEGGAASLGWQDRDLGPICRDCATLLIQVEMEQIFRKDAKKNGGGGKR